MGEYGKINIIVRKINPVYSIVSNDIVYRLRLQVRRCIGMSKMMYAVLSCMGVLVLIICDIQCIKRRTELGRRVAELLSIGALSVAGYTIIFLSSDYKWMSAGNCIFFAGMDWLCYAMFLYTIEYTKYKGKALFDLKPWMKLVTVIILTIDSVSMLCNIVLEHAMKFQVIYYRKERYLRFIPQPLFYLHLILCYIPFAVSFCIFLYKVYTAPHIYKRKFGFVILTLAGVMAANAMFLIMKPPVDISIYTYAAAAVLLAYFTFYYVPRQLEQIMQRLGQNKQKDLLIMFDEEDNCIYMNRSMFLFLKGCKVDREAFENAWDYENPGRRTAIQIDNNIRKIYAKEYEKLLDDKGRYMGCFYIMHDITKEREQREKYRYMATHDSLTGLYNRLCFFEEAELFMKNNPQEQYYIICSDIRQFKVINDIFGPEAGDRILRTIADSIRDADDHNRVYGRISGDSFAICMPACNFSEDSYFMRSGSTLRIKGINYPIVNHMGIYEVDDLSLPVSSMCDRAMLAISSMKNNVQQQIIYYDEHMRKEILQEQEILKDLTPAFEEKQFTIYIQPQFNHRTGEIAGGETLVRWKHPKKGLLKPQVFTSMMEDKGLISKLDRYVWRMACEFLKKLENQGKKISLSVNISPKDFYYLDLYREFMGLVKEYDISPAGLKLEITESAVIMDVPKQAALIEKLQAEGFVVEMDDFGSGYSSLNTLKDIPVDILKLDMKFMEKSKNTKRSADIVQMVVAMADKLGMPVIAEGVETKEQADFLGRIGCDIIQGYYYAKPMSMEEFEQLLNKYPYRDIVQKGIGNDI